VVKGFSDGWMAEGMYQPIKRSGIDARAISLEPVSNKDAPGFGNPRSKYAYALCDSS
jgi:hypothetical protein